MCVRVRVRARRLVQNEQNEEDGQRVEELPREPLRDRNGASEYTGRLRARSNSLADDRRIGIFLRNLYGCVRRHGGARHQQASLRG